jgi:hypothetical protein
MRFMGGGHSGHNLSELVKSRLCCSNIFKLFGSHLLKLVDAHARDTLAPNACTRQKL